jgi:hypothetical protein
MKLNENIGRLQNFLMCFQPNIQEVSPDHAQGFLGRTQTELISDPKHDGIRLKILTMRFYVPELWDMKHRLDL